MQASPLRKLAAAASARAAAGIKVYRLNIGQPDLPTPPAVFEAVRSFSQPTLAYAPSNGLPIPLTAWKSYYRQNGIEIDESEMVITAGGSEAIVFAMSAVCDPDDEIIVFEPFYTNYNGFATLASVNLRRVPPPSGRRDRTPHHAADPRDPVVQPREPDGDHLHAWRD